MEDTKRLIEKLIPQMDSPENVYTLFHRLKHNTLGISFKGEEVWGLRLKRWDLLHQENCREKGDTPFCACSARTSWLATG